ncbi:MAG: hypothetical protein ABJA37_08965 [Ferruginibacter sp.]
MNSKQPIIFNKKYMYSRIALLATSFLVTGQLIAQRDTTKKQSIDINSSFKPVLRSAAKINFSGSQLTADTTRPNLLYSIPAQNLFYAYQPISLKPLALEQDTNLYLGNRRYLKAGFGNFNTPYVSAGVSLGDGRTSLVNISGSYISSKGKEIVNQDYSQLNVKGAGSYFGKKNEVYAGASYSQDNYYLYGYDHNVYSFKRDEIRQQFQDITLTGGIKNTTTTSLKISYNPNAEVNFFTNKNRASETTLKINLPVEKQFGESFAFKVEAKADLTNYSSTGILANNIRFSNNLVQVAPAFIYHSPRLSFNGGVTPTWNNGKFVLLPNFYVEGQVKEKVFMVQAGWVGRYLKNTYKNLSGINPYLGPLTAENNTKEVEYYGGIKATVGKHFNFNAKVGYITYNDFPLYINDTATDNKTFLISNESKMKDLRIHGDISYINQDKFTFTAGLTINGYTGLQDHRKAWNTVPLEFTSALRYWAFKKLLLKGDFYFFAGGNALEKNNTSRAFTGGSDLSAGAEYQVNKQFSVWFDVNNIFDKKYERWHNYPVYGLNALGGILIHF